MRLFISSLFFCIVSCSSGPEWNGTRVIKDGIEYVNNTAKGLWRDSRSLVLKEILVIGEEESEDAFLAGPVDIAVDGRGNIYISDYTDNCVKVFAEDGNLLRKIGRQGQGPGEFERCMTIHISANDELCVNQSQRISVFTLDGDFLYELRPQNINVGVTSLATLTGKQGFFVTQIISDFIPLPDDKNIAIFQIDKKGNVIDSFGKLQPMGSTPNGTVYSQCHLFVTADDNIIVSNQYPYEIHFYDSDLIQKRTVTRALSCFEKPRLYNWKLNDELTFPNFFSRSRLGDIIPLPEKRFLVWYTDAGPDYYQERKNRLEKKEGSGPKYTAYYDLYDDQGRLLQSFPWDVAERGSIHFVDKDGFAYVMTTRNDLPVVLKCTLAFVEKQ
jgi:hypothetical protein